MSVYIRVQLSFWSHRKTIRLRSLIGNDALWLPIRLWSYAAANQPDGNFSDYTDSELAMLLGYDKDASSMRQALLQAGFLDANGTIHDWRDHNGYHVAFSERAKIAACAKWERVREEQSRKDKRRQDKTRAKHCLTDASSMYTEDFLMFWQSYPRRVGKGAASTAWMKVQQPKPTIEAVVAAVKAQAATDQWRKDNGKYIPHPATWLNQRRWEDDATTMNTGDGKPPPRPRNPDSMTPADFEAYMARRREAAAQ